MLRSTTSRNKLNSFPDISPPRFLFDRSKPVTFVEFLLHFTPDQEQAKIFSGGYFPGGRIQSFKLLEPSIISDLKLKRELEMGSRTENEVMNMEERMRNLKWE